MPPGTYTVKMTRGKETYTTKIVVGLDARAKYSLADRKLQFDTAMRVYNLLGDMSFEVGRINGVRDALTDRASRLGSFPAVQKQLNELADRADDMRKKIVATKEGGNITGELRIREKTTDLYGDFVSYEGRPSDYQMARVDSLKHELSDVANEFDAFVAKDLAKANTALAQKKLEPIRPLTRQEWDKADSGAQGGSSPSGAFGKFEKREHD